MTHLSIKDKKAVSKLYGTSSLYVFCPRNSTPSSISSQMISRKISPRYLPAMSFCAKGEVESRRPLRSLLLQKLVRQAYSSFDPPLCHTSSSANARVQTSQRLPKFNIR